MEQFLYLTFFGRVPSGRSPAPASLKNGRAPPLPSRKPQTNQYPKKIQTQFVFQYNSQMKYPYQNNPFLDSSTENTYNLYSKLKFEIMGCIQNINCNFVQTVGGMQHTKNKWAIYKSSKNRYSILILHFCSIFLISCNNPKTTPYKVSTHNSVQYANGFSIQNFELFSVLTVKKPWPTSKNNYTYILTTNPSNVPDSLQQFSIIKIPLKSIVVTSTTHIPSLEMLNVEKTLVGFPQLNYISSPKIRFRIDQNKIKELGNNQNLNLELLVNLQPDVIVGYGIDNHNPVFENIQKNGLKLMLNGDWNEETPLGKAEWIKFFGALYNKQSLANSLFLRIEKDYKATKKLALAAPEMPTVLIGDCYQDHWNLPKGNSWGCRFLYDAKSQYLWQNTNGTGSNTLSFESVFEKANQADFWFSSGQFSTKKEMLQSNPHYAQFKAFKSDNLYTFGNKKGKTGGIIYYELAPNRPDLVLKDLVKILHPELLKNYKPYFFEKLK